MVLPRVTRPQARWVVIDGKTGHPEPHPHVIGLLIPAIARLDTTWPAERLSHQADTPRCANPRSDVINASELPPALTVERAAELLGISRRSAYRAAAAGQLPSLRLGRRLLIPTGQLLDLLGITQQQAPVKEAV